MYSITKAQEDIKARGPRYAVFGIIRPGEAMTQYAPTLERAEKIRTRFEEARYRQVKIHAPVNAGGLAELAELSRARDAAKKTFDDATEKVAAVALRALEAGHAETEVARVSGLNRMTIRKWAGK